MVEIVDEKVPNSFMNTLFFSQFSKRPIIPIFSSNVERLHTNYAISNFY